VGLPYLRMEVLLGLIYQKLINPLSGHTIATSGHSSLAGAMNRESSARVQS
jgi:hypothetical protein